MRASARQDMALRTEQLVLCGGLVAPGPDEPPRRADVAVEGGLITGVGSQLSRDNARVIDCTGRVVMPGFVDAHSHADGMIFDEEVQFANLRQGVTTVIVGQDGVGFAPGSRAYAADYFGALDGDHPTHRGGGMASLLATYDDRVRVNVGALAPAGSVRHAVLGTASRAPTPDELKHMVEIVDRAMEQGALGLSTGLDYVPGLFASTSELAALCGAVAKHDGVHASHMRGGYEHAASDGIAELREIARLSHVRTHVAHFHAPADQVRRLIDESGFTFDAYPYRRGCTLLSMAILPPDLQEAGTQATLAALRDPTRRAGLADDMRARVASKPSFGPNWASNTTLAHIPSRTSTWAAGMTVAAAAKQAGQEPLEFCYAVLAESDLKVTVIVPAPVQRDEGELALIFTHPHHRAGSDGIYVGSHPHPRGWGTFARFLRRYLRERKDYDIPAAVAHLSTSSAETMRLGMRGRIRRGWVADLAVVDLENVADNAGYEHPRTVASGIDDVVVAGVPVLAHGDLTRHTPGRGIRKAGTIDRQPTRRSPMTQSRSQP